MTRKHLLYILLSLLGLCIACYPFLAGAYHKMQAEQIAKTHEAEALSESEAVRAEMLEAARAYNSELIGKHIKNIYIPAERDESSAYYSLLNQTGDGCMGSVEIPCIDLTLPIYHFTDETSLESGAGHLQGSSLPIGGKGSHAVLVAHRGLPGKRLFTDLDSVTVGAVFYLRVLGEELAYEVVSTEVVSPDDADSLAIDEENDKCTLVTCTPYGVNNMRLLVHGVRTEAENRPQDESSRFHAFSLHSAAFHACFAAAGIAAAILCSAVIDRKKKKRPKTEDGETGV